MRSIEKRDCVRGAPVALIAGGLAFALTACAGSSSDEAEEAQPPRTAEVEPSEQPTDQAESPPAADSETTPDAQEAAPEPSASEGCNRPYSASSPWNTPIGPSPVYDPDSALYVARLGDTLTSDPSQFTYPVYEVTNDTPLQLLRLSGWFSNVSGGGRLMQNDQAIVIEVPIPPDAGSAAGDDAQVIIVNVDTGEEWGAFRFGRSESGDYTAENAYHYNLDWDAVPPVSTGGGVFVSRGSGLPYLAGLVRPCELAARRIDHALAFAYDSPTSDYVYPATKSDGAGEAGADLPEGARLQLDPDLTDEELGDLGCTGPCLSVALAALMLATSPAHAATDSPEAQQSSVPAGWTWEAGPSTWVLEDRSPALRLASNRVQKAAAAALGRPVAVYCATSDAHWPAILASIPGLSGRAVAFAWFGRGPVVLSAGVCRQLERVAKHRGDRWDRARTVAILAHELGHVAGHVDEYAADCWSAGRSKRLARALGLERPMAVRRDVARFLGVAGANGCERLLDVALLRRSR